MVEVFKTNVSDLAKAEQLLHYIHHTFEGYKANFDLEDCDRILRIESAQMPIENMLLIKVIGELGFWAEVLEEERHIKNGK